MDSFALEAMKHVTRLSAEIGPRLQGSAANRAAAAYIQAEFSRLGLDVEVQEYGCHTWEHRQTVLTLNGEPLEAGANVFSVPCDVTAATCIISSLGELKQAEMAGRVAVLCGSLTHVPISPTDWFLTSDEDKHLIHLLQEKAPAAVLTVSPGAYGLPRIIEDVKFRIPSASVSARAGLKLVNAAGAVVHLRVETCEAPGTAANVVARKPSRGVRENAQPEKVVLCAHFDTKEDTPGAMDNAAGLGVLLATASALSRQAFPFDLEWVAFNGEETLPIGDDEYVRRAGDSFGRMRTVINFDGVGAAIASNTITLIGGSPAFQELLISEMRRFPGLVWVDPWPESNHSTFTWRGVPGIAFTSRGAAAVCHSQEDTIEWISPAKMGEAAAAGVEIVKALAVKTCAWTRT